MNERQYEQTRHSNSKGNNSIPIRNSQTVQSKSRNEKRSSHLLGSIAAKNSASRIHVPSGLMADSKAVIKKLLYIVRHTFYTVWKATKPLLIRLRKYIKQLPWKKIIPALVAVFIMIFLVFHFYLASPSRITNAIESNYAASQQLEDELKKSIVFVSQIPPYSSDIAEAEASLYSLSESAKQTGISLPPKLLSNYAYRDDEQKRNQLDSLYAASERINMSELQLAASQTNEMLQVSKDFFESNIASNTQSYIDQVKRIKQRIDAKNYIIQTDTIRRIFQQVLDSAEQYQLTKDIDNFNQQTNNITSELYKVIYVAWFDYAKSVQTNLSAFRSSTESIIISQ